MKRSLLGVIIGALLVASPVHAQRAALTPFGGWKWGGSASTQQGTLNTAASEHFGLELSVRTRQNASAFLLVDYQPTVLRLQSGGTDSELFDLDAWYFLAGGDIEVLGRGRVVPFALGALGVAWFDPSGDRSGETAFAGMFGGGLRVPLGQSGRVALRLEGRMYLTIPWGGTAMYCGTGGCYTKVGGTIGPVQGSVTSGLRFALGS